ncbi:MAG: TIGR02757 family protein [Chitinophagales bacterium]|nr:TIGR02757 family protein [Chitinophagales bacterium]
MTIGTKSLLGNNNEEQLHDFLEKKYREFNTMSFIQDDPIQIPHRFSQKQDIEIAAFFASILAWGNRKSIINSTNKLLAFMDNSPYNFVLNHNEKELKLLLQFKHRTFNATDVLYFVEFLKQHYSKFESLEDAFVFAKKKEENRSAAEVRLSNFHNYFFALPDAPNRTRKHIATPAKKSTCKRLNMFLRWMVRSDKSKVDFGIWKKIKPSELMCPLDVHVENVARQLHLINRKQRDWQTVVELTEALKKFDPKDPVKYDFALFGIGVSNKQSIKNFL